MGGAGDRRAPETPGASPAFCEMLGEALSKDRLRDPRGSYARVTTVEYLSYKLENLVATYAWSKFYLLATIAVGMVSVYSALWSLHLLRAYPFFLTR